MLQREHSAILSPSIKLPFPIQTLVLSIFKWQLKIGFTVYAEPKIRGPFHFEVFLFYITHTRYGIQVNIGCDLHISSPVSQTGAVHVTPDIDLDFMKYEGSLFFGCVYTCRSVIVFRKEYEPVHRL